MGTHSAKLRLIGPGSETSQDAAPTSVVSPIRSLRFLALDAHGRALDWIRWQDAACLYARDAVAWTLGESCLTVHGGTSRFTGERSFLDLHPIIAARGHARGRAIDPTPAPAIASVSVCACTPMT